MIRDVVLHMLNEQPFMADLFEMPTAADVGLLCTNVRTLDGRRPVFVDQIDSVFLFRELLHVPVVQIGVAVDRLHVWANAVLFFADDGDLLFELLLALLQLGQFRVAFNRFAQGFFHRFRKAL